MSPNTPLTQCFNLTPTRRLRVRTFQSDIFHSLIFQNSVCLPVPTCLRVPHTLRLRNRPDTPWGECIFLLLCTDNDLWGIGLLSWECWMRSADGGHGMGGTGNWLFEILDSAVTCRLFVVCNRILPATSLSVRPTYVSLCSLWKASLCSGDTIPIHGPARLFKLILIAQPWTVFMFFLTSPSNFSQFPQTSR